MLNSLLRCTLLPKIGNTDAIWEKYYVAIKSILDGTKVNWIDFLIMELMWCKHEVKGSLGYQPYIMALVKHVAALEGIDEVRHKSFSPRSNDPDFSTEDMPQPQASAAEGGDSSARGGARNRRRNAYAAVQGWAPPVGYFELSFEGIHAQV